MKCGEILQPIQWLSYLISIGINFPRTQANFLSFSTVKFGRDFYFGRTILLGKDVSQHS